MSGNWYVAVLETNSEGLIFAMIPDLPGVNASGATMSDALGLVREFADSYVRDLVENGQPVPEATAIDQIPVEPDAPELARALIPIEVPGRTVKISLSIDEALLKRADRAASRVGMSRSGFFAAAAEARIGERLPMPTLGAKAGKIALQTLNLAGSAGASMVFVSPKAQLYSDSTFSKEHVVTGNTILKVLAALQEARFVVPTDDENESVPETE
jgi:predicted RNase H-like HicB family nuclease